MSRLLAAIAALYKREPARCNGAIVSVLLAIAGVLGVTVDGSTVATVVAVVAPVLVAELTRPRVTPS